MTSAQQRALRQAVARADAAAAAKTEILDVLLALLHHHGGELRVPAGAVASARRQEIVVTFTPDDLIIQTKERAGAQQPGIARRVLGSLFGGN